jgi:transposase
MRRPNKKYVVRLEAEEQERLQRLVSVGNGAAAKLTRGRVLLQADESGQGPGWTDARIAEGLGVTVQTIENIRRRFVEEGLERALERKKQCRPSRERLLDGAKEARLVAMCCSKPPAGRRRWTLRLLADRLVELKIVESIGHETVRRTLQKTNLSPGGNKCGVFRPKPTPSSSARWRMSWRSITGRTIANGRSSAWTKPASSW